MTIDLAYGDRLRLVSTTDPYTHLKPGAEGAVVGVQLHAGIVTVKWDDGHHLALIIGEDRWERIP